MSFSKLSTSTAGAGISLDKIYDVNNPLCDVKEIIDNASSLLYNNILKTLEIKKDVVVKVSHFVSLASSLVSFVSSLIVAVKTSLTGYIRVALYMSPVASLIGVVASISALLASLKSKRNVQFDTQCAYATINNITETLREQSQAPTPNALGTAEYLHYGIGLIGIILTAGLAKFTFAPKDVNTWLSMREHVTRFTTDIEGFVRDLIEKVFNIDLTQDIAFSNKMQSAALELEEMLKTPATTFILDRSSYDRLHACATNIRKISEMKFTPEQARRYSQMRSTFATGYAKLLETIRVISSVVDASIRPTGIGLVLQGAPGIGKSECAQYILKRVGRAMRYSQKIYNIKPGPSGNYYEIYSGESLGIYNEFCASRQDNSGIAKMNEVLSSDPCNLEAADVGYKHQPCKLTLVVFTANKPPNSYYDFTTQMTEDANMALMTRLFRVQVTDPHFTSRHDANPHRNPEFTHLTLNALNTRKPSNEINSLSDYADTVQEPLTMEELINTLIQRCAANEMHYIRKILSNITELPQDIVEGLEKRVAQLTAIQMHNVNPIVDNEVRSSKTLPFITRVQGPIHTGKTELALQVGSTISASLNIPIVEIKDFSELPDVDRPQVYILDDIPSEDYETETYVQWLNNVHYQSIVIIATNKVFPIQSTPMFSLRRLLLAFTAAYDCPSSLMMLSFYINLYRRFVNLEESYYDMSSLRNTNMGYLRRLGISGLAKTENYLVIPGNSLCITTRLDSSVFVGLDQQPVQDLGTLILDSYYDYLRRNFSFTIIHAEPPQVEPDVNVEVRNFELYSQEIMSPQGCLDMFLNPDHPAAKITVSREKQDFILRSSNVASWVMPVQPRADTFLQSVLPNLKRLVAVCPGIVVRMSYNRNVFLFKDNILYTTTRFDLGVEIVNGMMYVNNKAIECGPAALYYTRGISVIDDGSLSPYSGSELVAVRNYIQSNYSSTDLQHYTAAIESQLATMRTANTARKTHILLKFFSESSPERNLLIGIGGALATITAGLGLYKLMCLLITTNDDDCIPNRDKSPPNSLSKDHSEALNQEYVSHVMGGKGRNTKTFIQEKIASGEHAERMSKWERYRQLDHQANTTKAEPNATLVQIDMFRKHLQEKSPETIPAFEKMIKAIPIDATPCSVHIQDVITKQDTLLSNMRQKLERATLVVRNGTSVNYGILIKDNYFITVAHAGDIGDELIAIWSSVPDKPGKSYLATPIARSTEKDLMVCEIKDSSFPPAKDITRDLVSMYERADWSGRAIYMRTIPGGETFFGNGTYLGKRSVGLTSSTTPSWNPDNYITYNTYSFDSAFGVHRRGDCGLPLISVINNKPFIVGIHNSVTSIGGANFSPTFREEILSVITNSSVEPNSANVSFLPTDSVVPGMEGLKSMPDYNSLFEQMRPTTIWSNHPEINVKGYCHPLKMYSKPAFHKQLVYNERESQFPVICRPSPMTIKDLTPQAIEFLPKDMRGVPSPLLAQTKKFFHPHKMEVDPEIYSQATEMHKEMLRAYIGSVKHLRNHEMINGILEGNLKPIDLSTSAGTYFKAVHRINTKQSLFVNYNQNDKTKPQVLGYARTPAGEELALQVESIKAIWSEGKGVVVVIKDNPKVELLSIEDVEQEGKIRLFCEMDASLNLALRSILGDYISKCHQFHHQLPSRLGFNPFTFPQAYMTQFPGERRALATDIKRLDKNYPVELITDFFEAVADLAEDDIHKLMLLGASKSFDKTIHIQDGVVYVVEGGNPSGVVGTTPLNCFLGDRIAMYVYLKWTRRAGLKHLQFFSTFIKLTGLATYGDDQLWLLDEQCSISMEDIQLGFKEFGLEIVPSKNFSSKAVEFCSREIVRDDRHCIWLSRLKKESILGGIYYLDVNRRNLIPQQLTMVLFEASFWDENFFNKVKQEVFLQIESLNLNTLDFKFFSWKQQRAHLANYIRGEVRCPIVTEIGTVDMDVSPYEQRYLRDKLFEMPDYVTAYYDRCRKLPDHTKIDRTHSHRSVLIGDSRTFHWRVELTHSEYSGIGEDVDLSQAVRYAFEELYINRFGESVDEDAVFSTARSTSVNVRYSHVTSPDDASTYWTLHADNEMIADGEVENCREGDVLQPDLTDKIANSLHNPKIVSVLHNNALTVGSLDRTSTTDLREHQHTCDKCGRRYVHTHFFRHVNHQQRSAQCPNINCPWAGTMAELARTKARLL
uniref:SF3 helicase domain-containing protein n=1 Tax=Insect picorna-like virus 1 TaxID=2819086 RepID=A0A7G9IR77_9PICO|nr:hypothetical protein [Insect picorna-like virus 1]